MALILKDRVQETSTTTGTGTLTLAGAVTQFQTFSSAIGNGNTTYYTIYNAGGTEWEVGLGTVGAGTLARTTVLASSNAGAAVNFTGTLYVFGDYPADKAIFANAAGNIENASLTSPKINEILDTSGNEVLGLSPTASATDYLVVKNGIGVGVPLHIYADGSSANTGLHIQPKGTGLVTISDGTDFNKGIRFRSSSSSASAITLLDAVATAGRVVTLPDATTTLVGRDTTDTLTNKSISGSTNTLSSIANASLTNSAITINGTSTSLGGSISVGSVTSVAATVPSFLSVAGSPITSSGTLAISLSGTALPAANGGTGLTSPGTAGYVLTSDGTGWVSQAVSPTGSTYTRTSFTATGGQTSFTVTYTVGYVEVFLNGVLLNASDYTASSGTAVVLATAAVAGDILETIAYNTTSVGTASTATNIAGGIASQIPYQTGAGATAFIANGTSGQVLTSNGTSAPTWTSAGDATTNIGFLNIPQNSQSAAYTLVLGDSGEHIFHPSADTTARTWTIPANSSVAFPIGTAVTFINQNGAGVITIAITTDTMRLAGAGTTGSRTLAANGVATAIKIAATEWIISGTGLT